MKHSDYHIVLIRVAVGIFFLFIGIAKIKGGWVTSNEHLNKSLVSYNDNAHGLQKTYLNVVAIPLSAVWSPLIALGETLLGVSLILGFLTRASTFLGFLMILNFHFTNGNLFSTDFFESTSGLLLLSILLVLFLARAGLRWGIDAIMAVTVTKRKGKSSKTKVN